MSITGMDRDTGQPLAGIDHVKKSITDILTTPVGSRVMRPEYGSYLRRFVDRPINSQWIAEVQAEAARAIGRWEPRVRVRRIVATAIVEGRIELSITAEYLADLVLLEVTV